jgi:hypothetical protein
METLINYLPLFAHIYYSVERRELYVQSVAKSKRMALLLLVLQQHHIQRIKEVSGRLF